MKKTFNGNKLIKLQMQFMCVPIDNFDCKKVNDFMKKKAVKMLLRFAKKLAYRE
jgi:hypothetical protein